MFLVILPHSTLGASYLSLSGLTLASSAYTMVYLQVSHSLCSSCILSPRPLFQLFLPFSITKCILFLIVTWFSCVFALIFIQMEIVGYDHKSS